MPCGDLPIEDKILLVTGGGSGINLCFVETAAKLKPRGIIVADLRLTDEAQNKFNELKRLTELRFVRTDVAKRMDLENLIHTSKDVFQDVPDIYIAGAAVFEPVRQTTRSTCSSGLSVTSLGQTGGMTLRTTIMPS